MPMPPPGTYYYRYEMPAGQTDRLLRKIDDGTGITEMTWDNGQWERTDLINQYMAGHTDQVDPISEAEAKQLAPAAFALSAAS